jgi:hypothetical protein
VEHCFVVAVVACVLVTGGIGWRNEGQSRVGGLQSGLGSLPAGLASLRAGPGEVRACARHPEQY